MLTFPLGSFRIQTRAIQRSIPLGSLRKISVPKGLSDVALERDSMAALERRALIFCVIRFFFLLSSAPQEGGRECSLASGESYLEVCLFHFGVFRPVPMRPSSVGFKATNIPAPREGAVVIKLRRTATSSGASTGSIHSIGIEGPRQPG